MVTQLGRYSLELARMKVFWLGRRDGFVEKYGRRRIVLRTSTTRISGVLRGQPSLLLREFNELLKYWAMKYQIIFVKPGNCVFVMDRRALRS
jgi:hypothetical protein